jgi:hypothetical protein
VGTVYAEKGERRRDGGIGHALTMAETQTSLEFKEARCSGNKETSAAFLNNRLASGK